MALVTDVGLKTPSIFIDFEKYNQNIIPSAKIFENKPDTFEKQISDSGKKVKNKKLIVAGVAVGVAAIAAVAFRKDIAGYLKKISNQVSQNGVKIDTTNVENKASEVSEVVETTIKRQRAGRPIPKSADEHIEKAIRNGKKFLIDDVETFGEAAVNGICFYGPDSIGKEAVIDDFLSTLENAGYVIKKVPRIKDTPMKTIVKSIYSLQKEAEELYKNTKQRSIIVVRDLAEIAKDPDLFDTEHAIGPLLCFEKCKQRGYSWVAEATNTNIVELGVKRPGRIEHFILCRPSLKDSKEVWEKYVDLLGGFRYEGTKEVLLKDAMEKMKSLAT